MTMRKAWENFTSRMNARGCTWRSEDLCVIFVARRTIPQFNVDGVKYASDDSSLAANVAVLCLGTTSTVADCHPSEHESALAKWMGPTVWKFYL